MADKTLKKKLGIFLERMTQPDFGADDFNNKLFEPMRYYPMLEYSGVYDIAPSKPADRFFTVFFNSADSFLKFMAGFELSLKWFADRPDIGRKKYPTMDLIYEMFLAKKDEICQAFLKREYAEDMDTVRYLCKKHKVKYMILDK